jgi:hypothetical protein
MLIRELMLDAELKRYSVVILDEVLWWFRVLGLDEVL